MLKPHSIDDLPKCNILFGQDEDGRYWLRVTNKRGKPLQVRTELHPAALIFLVEKRGVRPTTVCLRHDTFCGLVAWHRVRAQVMPEKKKAAGESPKTLADLTLRGT